MNTPEIPTPDPARPPETSAPQTAKAPWFFWGSMGWMLAGFIAWIAAQFCVLFAILLPYLSAHPGAHINSDLLTDLMTDGLTIAMVTSASIPFWLAVLFLAVRLRHWSAREYFALFPFTLRQFGFGVAAIVATVLATELVGSVTNNESQPAFMEDMMKAIRSGPSAIPLLLTAIIVAPIGEEMIFRGFLYRGLAASRLGVFGAIVICAALWSVIHTQYDLFYVGVVFVLGLSLGAIRAWSGSTFLTIILHALVNLAAFAQFYLPDKS